MNTTPNGHHPERLPELDGVSSRDETEVRAYLSRWPAPPADPDKKALLIQQMRAELGTEAPAAQPTAPSGLRHALTWAALILRSQLRIVHSAIWVASALVLALGLIVTLLAYQPDQTWRDLPFVVLAPLVTALGVAFLYGMDADPALELQFATPISPRRVLLARLALLFGFNLVLCLGASVVLALLPGDLSLWPLIMAWLAPMTFLSALAFFMSVLFFDPLQSVLLSLLLWTFVAARPLFIETAAWLTRLPDLWA
ncbi:MAG: hypothetical protein GYB67_09960, partial [Chloroflexi bacterium]|nr:hypothetical protein [Chloroflexota bacterium]